MSSILSTLRNAYPQLSASKKKVASYFLNNYSTLHMDTVTELAEKIGVSDTTIINMCTELGFNGYSGFRKMAKNEILSASGSNVSDTLENADRIGRIRSWISQKKDILSTISDSTENVENMIKAVDLLGHTKKIYIIGFWSSSAVAKAMALRFLFSGFNSEAIYPDMGDYIDHLLWTEEGSVAIVYDFSLYVTSLTEVCSILQERKIKIILITDNGPCPRISMADVVINAHSGSEGIASMVTETLLQEMITAYPKEKTEYNVRLREGVFTRFNPYGVIEPSGGKVPRI